MSQDDSKVVGHNEENSGETYGVWGEADSTSGYGLGTPDDARIDGVVDGGAEWTVEVEDGGLTGNVVQGDPENSADAGSSGQTVSGGNGNITSADYSTIGGGDGNEVTDSRSTIGGGWNNLVSDALGTVGGGEENEASGSRSTVGGGEGNRATAQYATIAGGGRATFQSDSANHVYDEFGTIGGGGNNRAGLSGSPTAKYATVSGGMHNDATGESASIGGGWNNTASGSPSTVAGGEENEATANRASVAGGYDNTATGVGSSVGGGQINDASGVSATAAGGQYNVASGDYASVGGGDDNEASGSWSTVFGGRDNTASGDYSAAGGRWATAAHDGSFVWGDSSSSTFSSTSTDQFLVDGDVGIGIDDPANQFHVAGRSTFDSRVGVGTDSPARSFHVKATGTSSVSLVLEAPSYPSGWAIGPLDVESGGLQFYQTSDVTDGNYGGAKAAINTNGDYLALSDERLKRDIEELDGILDDVLELRPTTYLFENSAETESRSYGFIAQDVQPLFPDVVEEIEGDGHLSLSYANFSVLAIQAIQEQQDLIDAQDDALEQLSSKMDSMQDAVSEKRDRVERLERESEHKDDRIDELVAKNDALSERLSAVEERLSTLPDSDNSVPADD